MTHELINLIIIYHILINNFSEAEENAFRQWTYKYFEFKLSKVNKSGIISIKIDQKDEESENLVDVGFGYSQLLPIILQLWRFKRQAETVSNNSVKCHCYIFLIEQPELYLHPAFQRRLLRAIVDIQNECKQNNVIIKVILETHSATIIDELGRITDEELLAPDDSIIYIFHKKMALVTFLLHNMTLKVVWSIGHQVFLAVISTLYCSNLKKDLAFVPQGRTNNDALLL